MDPLRLDLHERIERLEAENERLRQSEINYQAAHDLQDAENERLRAALERAMDDLLRAAEGILREIERRPGGYDYRPYFTLRSSSQLNDPCRAVLELIGAVKAVGGKVPPDLERM